MFVDRLIYYEDCHGNFFFSLVILKHNLVASSNLGNIVLITLFCDITMEWNKNLKETQN